MAAKTETPKRRRRHSFTSLPQTAREMESSCQQQSDEYSGIAGIKRQHSPNACASEGGSLKKPALWSDREPSDFLCLPAGELHAGIMKVCESRQQLWLDKQPCRCPWQV